MANDKSGEMAINMPESKASAKGKAPLLEASARGKARLLNSWKTRATIEQPNRGVKRGFAIGDFILRLCAIAATLGATVAMGTAEETLPFFTQFFQFQAQYDDFDAFRFFVIALALVSGYLLLSLPFSIVCIIRPFATAPRVILVIFDAVMAGVTIAAGSAAAAIVYLAHNGNPNTNWLPVCQQFGDFCQTASGAVVGSLIAGTLIVLLMILAAFSLRRS